MKEMRYLLKIGKKKHIEEFAGGVMYCSNAEIFWKIEEKKKIRGQGDLLEAGGRLFGQRVEMHPYDNNDPIIINAQIEALFHIEPAKNIPVFCLFTVYDEDCEMDSYGNCTIKFSNEKKKTIREHFPDADAVAIITNPQQFLYDVKGSIGYRVEHDFVHYFHIDEGFEINGKQDTAMDMEFMKYMTQDTPPVATSMGKKYSFTAEYAFRCLFCKDVFFTGEQEYRIVLPENIITEGTKYPVRFKEKMQIVGLNDFLK